jgi:hypothetical protein
MATNRKVVEDTGSEELKLVRKQLNRLTVFMEAVKAAATTDGDTFMTAVAALTEDADFENLTTDLARVEAPKPPTT